MGYNPHGHARINPRQPAAIGVCDLCGFQYQLSNLRWEVQWAGMRVQRTGFLVCPECWSPPQPQLRAIVIPPDPIPKMYPRPEPYSSEVPSYRGTEAGLIRGTESDNPRTLEGTESYTQTAT